VPGFARDRTVSGAERSIGPPRARRDRTGEALRAIGTDFAVVGDGPATMAAALILSAAGHRVAWLPPPAVDRPDLDILLPPSALRELAFLGLGAAARAVSQPAGPSVVRWGTSGSRSTSLTGLPGTRQVAERDIRAVFEGALSARGVRAVRAAVKELGRSGDGVVVRAEAGRVFQCRAVLCGEAALAGDEAGAATGPTDRVRIETVEATGSGAPPAAGHRVEAGPYGWTWTLRRADGCVQPGVSALARAGPGPSPSPGGTQLEVRPSMPPRPRWPEVLGVGRAAGVFHPLSSLGSTHALHGARQSAIAARAFLEGRLPAGEVAAWHRGVQVGGAVRTHALTALACRDALSAHPTPYWRDRSDPGWALVSVEDEVAARAVRAVRLVEEHREGRFFDMRLAAQDRWAECACVVVRGATLRASAARRPAGGLPIPISDLGRLSPLLSEFTQPRTIGEVVGAAGPGPPGCDTEERGQRSRAQDIAHLFELGALVEV